MQSRQDQVRELAPVASSSKYQAGRSGLSHDSPALVTDFAFDVGQIPHTSRTGPSALSRSSHTGRKKLIFSSTVVKASSGASVLANAIPNAASAMSQRIPPCS